MEKTLAVMAAGMGSRYGGLKQLDSVGPSEETIIDYSVFDAWKSGFRRLVFIIRKDIEAEFREKVGDKYASRLEVRYVFQELDRLPEGFSLPAERNKPWGTGQALLAAREEIREPFLIINADDLYGREAFQAAGSWLETMPDGKTGAALAGYYLKNTLSENGSVARGICRVDKEDYLTGVTEVLGIRRDSDGILHSENGGILGDDDLVSMNMWLFTPLIFDSAQNCFSDFLKTNLNNPRAEFYIPSMVSRLISEEALKVKVLKTAGKWHGVTYREDKQGVMRMIEEAVRSGIYPEKLWEC